MSEDATPYVAYISEEDSITHAVMGAVATVSGRPPLTNGTTSESSENDPLPPLNDVIDADALNILCQPTDDDSQTETTVTFTYSGYTVTVKSGGTVTVTER
ncbi:HalOD1 output domain-containing protein [Natronococcus amylolyticus]|uniref:HalOD1 output domain-containing protein n=1 Tax=Natronococcus amylolyticus TaxID=44470 RepID=UPI0012686FF8|nr:HalOD1 output domain-containing protein [Natronococcus amylolyticus]